MLGKRIGEASNPGYGILDPSLTRLKVTSTRCRGNGIKYAEPHKDGFRDVHTPGFRGAEGGAVDGTQDRGLRIESANTIGTRSLRKRLKATQADVLMVQETWATGAVVDEIASWAKRRRWTSLWTPAKEGTNGGRPSEGTAIFARDHLGLRKPDWGSEVWVEHRATAGVLEAPNMRPLLCVSAYFQCSKGWSDENLNLMAAICDGIGKMGGSKGRAIPCVVGADVNMPPEECVKASALGDAGLQVVSPSTPRGTFRTRTSARCIDYFLVSGCMTDLIRRVGTVEGSGIAGHVPVTLDFKPRATAQKALVLRAPPPLPCERVYGPLPAPPTYSNAMRLAKLAVRAAERREDGATQQYWLDAAYAAFANDLEEEMCGVTGAAIEARRKKGAKALRWRGGRYCPKAQPRSRSARRPTTLSSGELHAKSQRWSGQESRGYEMTHRHRNNLCRMDTLPREAQPALGRPHAVARIGVTMMSGRTRSLRPQGRGAAAKERARLTKGCNEWWRDCANWPTACQAARWVEPEQLRTAAQK